LDLTDQLHYHTTNLHNRTNISLNSTPILDRPSDKEHRNGTDQQHQLNNPSQSLTDSEQITSFIQSMGTRPNPHHFITAINGESFQSASQFDTIATAIAPTGKLGKKKAPPTIRQISIRQAMNMTRNRRNMVQFIDLKEIIEGAQNSTSSEKSDPSETKLLALRNFPKQVFLGYYG
jgi:hypothetical protein